MNCEEVAGVAAAGWRRSGRRESQGTYLTSSHEILPSGAEGQAGGPLEGHCL